MKPEQSYIELFEQHKKVLSDNAPEVMNRVRETAFERFVENGFPTTADEGYLYSDVAALFASDYGMNARRLEFPVDPYSVFRCDVPNLSTQLFFMVNDAFYREQLPKSELPKGVFVGNMSEFLKTYPDIAAKRYAALADCSGKGFVAFNTAFAQDAFVLYVPEGVAMDRAIQVVNILRGDVDLLVNRRFLIIIENRAEAKLLLCDHGMDDVRFLATQVVEVFLGEGAVFDLYELEDNMLKTSRLSSVFVEQQASSRFSHNGIALSNGFTRNNLFVSLRGEYAETVAGGIVIADGRQHVDNSVWIDHKAANCQSNELYKYILDNQSTGAFNGRVVVHPHAQKTAAHQTNRNLCLTKEARMFSRPQLEIYADDVKCSHGLTTGQIDEAALFYMRSRGISRDEAMLLLKFAFTADVLDLVRLDPLKDRLRMLIEKRLRSKSLHCGCCSSC